MDLQQYLRPDAISRLSEQIGMPPEVTAKIAALAGRFDFSPLAAPIGLLFDCATAPEGVRMIQALLGPVDEAPLVWLAIWLGAALRTHEHYRLKGIDDTVFYSTMSCFSRFVREHRESYGVYGFDRSFWTYRQIAMRLFRLGTLEYEMVDYRGPDIRRVDVTLLTQGTPVLSVHIPSDARLGGANCHESYRQANAFFQKHYPEFAYPVFYTNTWLLSPSLQHLLPADSKILNFQKDFRIIGTDAENDAYRSWVFKNPSLKPADYPENTSLQRQIKAFVLAGGKIGVAAGIIGKRLSEFDQVSRLATDDGQSG